MKYSQVIAMDGPSGSGKSTIAKEVAKSLNIVYIDTGAMFRAIGIMATQQQIAFEESDELNDFLINLNLEYGVSDDVLIMAQGQDLTARIREHHVSDLASRISKLPSVRNFLLDFQRKLGQERTCVMEGRDIGTVVFPNAFCKIFMTASDEVRALRRLKQLHEMGDDSVEFDQIMKDIKERDERDSGRDLAPLKPAEDAIRLDTSNLAFNEVLEKISNIARERGKKLGIEI